ncbi:hypothetical protein THRCLA_00845 [Thraustotheca clavata]|uniref:PX domain-containing protein n=1 Tax=Thraustotheca clavata TaxID=74557 RepID=A0A1W0AA68_9STRA|nr:hypothetical protein THRCLA_00845 [Thraustotheca clavata]
MSSALGNLSLWSKEANAINHIDHITLTHQPSALFKRPFLLQHPVILYSVHVHLRKSLSHLANINSTRHSQVGSYALQVHIVHHRFSEFYQLNQELNEIVKKNSHCVYCYQVLTVLDDTMFPHRGIHWIYLRKGQLEHWMNKVLKIVTEHPGQFENRCDGFRDVMHLLICFFNIHDIL